MGLTPGDQMGHKATGVPKGMSGGATVVSKEKGQLDPCHYNFLKLDFMLKSMPLSGMIFNMKPNFTEL